MKGEKRKKETKYTYQICSFEKDRRRDKAESYKLFDSRASQADSPCRVYLPTRPKPGIAGKQHHELCGPLHTSSNTLMMKKLGSSIEQASFPTSSLLATMLYMGLLKN